jgi:hypothetical protein
VYEDVGAGPLLVGEQGRERVGKLIAELDVLRRGRELMAREPARVQRGCCQEPVTVVCTLTSLVVVSTAGRLASGPSRSSWIERGRHRAAAPMCRRRLAAPIDEEASGFAGSTFGQKGP